MAATEAGVAMQVRLNQADSKLLRAIEDALARIRQERFGSCEECGQPISKARLEAAPWARHCRDCKERQDSQS
jgi:DnaK suppressor protein